MTLGGIHQSGTDRDCLDRRRATSGILASMQSMLFVVVGRGSKYGRDVDDGETDDEATTFSKTSHVSMSWRQ